jgi:hypothetical protein
VLPLTYLKSQLDYFPESGMFVWKITRHRIKAGQLAGSKHLGYVRIKLQGSNYAAHRLAWLFIKGVWPEHEIDHINGIRGDNRFSNLREATHSQNLQNCNTRQLNKCGLRGAYKQTSSNSWMASITANSVKYHLGTYASAEEAHEAYLKAAKIYHGDFANLTTANHKEKPMSRKSSVVLTPAEKKLALKEAKDALKAANAAAKELEKQAKVVAKARAAEDKEAAKLATAAQKAVDKAQADVDALTAE